MAIYKYVAQDEKGKEYRGVIGAASHYEIASKLEEKNLFLMSWKEEEIHAEKKENTVENEKNTREVPKQPVRSKSRKKKNILSFSIMEKRITLKDLAIITHQLVISLKSGLTLSDALEIILMQVENQKLKHVIEKIMNGVIGGKSFSNAIMEFPKVFSTIYQNMVLAGENGGFLDRALENIVIQLEKMIEIKSNIKNNIIYPAFIFFVALLCMIFMTVFVIPVFVDVFNSLDTDVPYITRMILLFSSILRNYWYIHICLLSVVLFLLYKMGGILGKNIFLDKKLLEIPLLGNLLKKITMSRFVSTLSILIKSGVPILDALMLSRGVVGNSVVAREIDTIYQNVQSGRGIAEKMYSSKYFPLLVANMVHTGERSGNLPETLRIVSEYYDKEVNNALHDFFTILEPMLIVFMGVMVGFLAVGMLLPIFNLPGAIG